MATTMRADEDIRRILALRDQHCLSWRTLSEEVGEPVWRLRYWARRVSASRAATGSGFVELVPAAVPRAAEPATGDHRYIIELPSGARIHVDRRFDPEELRRVVIAVRESC